MHSLPLFLKLEGRPVILLGDGPMADAKRRLLERAGATFVGEDVHAALAIVAIEDEVDAQAAVTRLKARGILVNAVDRAALCDFTLPAIIDRDPVLVAIGTGGTSAGLAAALRRRLEALLPATLGHLAAALHRAREDLLARWPDPVARRRAIAEGLSPGGAMDPLGPDPDVPGWLAQGSRDSGGHDLIRYALTSPDPDDLTLRQARDLANADRIYHAPDVPPAILDRARADAQRIGARPPATPDPGLSLWLEMHI